MAWIPKEGNTSENPQPVSAAPATATTGEGASHKRAWPTHSIASDQSATLAPPMQ